MKELAKTLNIGNDTIQSLIQNYPQLRHQLAAYHITDMFGTFSACASFSFIFLWCVSFLFVEDVGSPKAAFWRKIIFLMAIVFVILSLIAYSFKYILAPDVIFIQTILGNLK